jgi:hypothetical protein
MVMFYVLIYAVSLALQSPVSLNIYNQCQGIKLISPVYFIHGGSWNVVPDQEIGINAVMRNLIEFDSGQNILEGILIYKMQRQYAKSYKFIQHESESIVFLAAWHVDHTKELHIRALLVKHDGEFDWNEEKLRMLHQKYWHLLKTQVDPIENNWLLNDTTVLATTIKVMNGGYKWYVSISKGVKDNIKRPLQIDVKR